MKFIVLASLIASALAAPAELAPRTYDACEGGIFSNAQCCATDVLGLADLDCYTPNKTPSSATDFRSTCAAGGQRARCCVIPVAGQALLCITPVGV